MNDADRVLVIQDGTVEKLFETRKRFVDPQA